MKSLSDAHFLSIQIGLLHYVCFIMEAYCDQDISSDFVERTPNNILGINTDLLYEQYNWFTVRSSVRMLFKAYSFYLVHTMSLVTSVSFLTQMFI